MTDTTLTYQGNVSGGAITLPKRLRQEVVSVFDGKQIEVTFRRRRKRRSNEQNKYYWGVVIPEIMRGMIDLGNEALQMGNSEHVELVHEYLKHTLLDNGEEISGADGVMFKLPPSTSKCTTTEFLDYVERIRIWAADNLNISIPEPNEQVEMFTQ